MTLVLRVCTNFGISHQPKTSLSRNGHTAVPLSKQANISGCVHTMTIGQAKNMTKSLPRPFPEAVFISNNQQKQPIHARQLDRELLLSFEAFCTSTILPKQIGLNISQATFSQNTI
mmetsp:Transcript_11921/g.34926  ORF Transcript_11921/g.34926 Transcript_11921/m.34926 type:complete len:116 (+) Transcript_11921:38-385(+)